MLQMRFQFWCFVNLHTKVLRAILKGFLLLESTDIFSQYLLQANLFSCNVENFNSPTHEKLLFILKILQLQQSLTKCGKSAEIVEKGYSHSLFSHFSESTSWLPSFSLSSTPMVTTLLTKTPLYCR